MARKGKKVSHSVTEKTSTPPKDLLSSDEISNGISSLLKTLRDSAEIENPSYNNESATIYLQFASKNIKRSDPIGRVNLPNSLSYVRSVCVIARGTVIDKTLSASLKALIKEIGIKGKVKVIPVEDIKATIAAKNEDELFALAKKYDSFIAPDKVLRDIAVQGFYTQMSKLRKHVNKIMGSSSEEKKACLKAALDRSIILANKEKDAYVWRVGHVGMSESAIAENVTAALSVLSTWTTSFPAGLAHFSAVRLANGAGAAVELYANDGEVEPEKPYRRHEHKEHFTKADDQLYWMNRMQQKDGTPYWKTSDKKTRNIIKGKSEAVAAGAGKNQAARVQRLQVVRAERAAGASPKKPWMAGGGAGSGKKLSPWKAGAPGSGKKSPKKPKTPKTGTPQAQVTPKPGTPQAQVTPKLGTPQNTPGSGKKRKNKGGTPVVVGNGTTPVKAETPGEEGAAKKMKMTPQSAQPPAPVSADGTPGSGKKRRRSRKDRTPGTPGQNTPVKVATPGEKTPLKENTPLAAKPTTPGSVKVEASANDATPAGTPGSGKKRRRSRNKGSPATAQTKENTAEGAAKVVTPAAVAAAAAGTPGNVKTPGSGGKRRRTRKSLMPGTPGVGTPGTDGKKSPGMKMRLRQRPSMGFAMN